MEAIGGYFSLELNDGLERRSKGIRLNDGRYALEYILKARKYSKVYLPYFICDSVLEPIERQHVEYEFYHINEQLEPATELYPKDDEAVLYVNYFGLKNRRSGTFCYAYPNTILDQTQAFYSEPGNKYAGIEYDKDFKKNNLVDYVTDTKIGDLIHNTAMPRIVLANFCRNTIAQSR